MRISDWSSDVCSSDLGLPGWGAKSAAAVLDRWGHLEDIPEDPLTWDAGVRSAAKLNATLREQFALALLLRRLATVETDAQVGSVASWLWTGPTDDPAPAAIQTPLEAPESAVHAEKQPP